jgi:hypothetical protein
MSEYVSLDPNKAMGKFAAATEVFLNKLLTRGRLLGCLKETSAVAMAA